MAVKPPNWRDGHKEKEGRKKKRLAFLINCHTFTYTNTIVE
jgi:hypothetical protein